jgi:hypothetical protein
LKSFGETPVADEWTPEAVLQAGSTKESLKDRQQTPKSQADLEGGARSQSMTLEAKLADWIKRKCTESPPSRSLHRELNQIFREIYKDRRFWRYLTQENALFYEDALHLMWRYFDRNLCVATTARKSSSFFDTRSTAVGRLLKSLKGNLKNLEKRQQTERSHQNVKTDDEGDVVDLEDYVPSAKPELALLQFDAFLLLLETDPTGELRAEENYLCGRDNAYQLTAQQYLLMRHRDDKTIQQIADELGIPRGSVQGGAKPTRWKQLERKLAEMARDSVVEGG